MVIPLAVAEQRGCAEEPDRNATARARRLIARAHSIDDVGVLAGLVGQAVPEKRILHAREHGLFGQHRGCPWAVAHGRLCCRIEGVVGHRGGAVGLGAHLVVDPAPCEIGDEDERGDTHHRRHPEDRPTPRSRLANPVPERTLVGELALGQRPSRVRMPERHLVTTNARCERVVAEQPHEEGDRREDEHVHDREKHHAEHPTDEHTETRHRVFDPRGQLWVERADHRQRDRRDHDEKRREGEIDQPEDPREHQRQPQTKAQLPPSTVREHASRPGDLEPCGLRHASPRAPNLPRTTQNCAFRTVGSEQGVQGVRSGSLTHNHRQCHHREQQHEWHHPPRSVHHRVRSEFPPEPRRVAQPSHGGRC